MTDEEDIINSILNEETTYELNYNTSNYNINDIMNEKTDESLYIDKPKEAQEESKEESQNSPKEETHEESKKVPLNDISKEAPKESKEEAIKDMNIDAKKESSKEPKIESNKESNSYINKEIPKQPKIELNKESNNDINKESPKEPKMESSQLNNKERDKKIESQGETPSPLSEDIIKKEIEKRNELRKKEKDEQLKRDLEKIIEEENNKKEKAQEEIKKKKRDEDMKKLENLYPPFLNPLDFIQYLEVYRIGGQISNEMKNFIIQNHRKKDNKYEVSSIIPLSKIIGNVKQFDIKVIYAKYNILVLCTKEGNLLFYNIKDQELLKMIVPKNVKDPCINCIDITDDFSEILCGYQDGTILLINYNTEDVKYTNNKIHKDCSCIELKIYKKDKKELYFISSGGDGQVFFHTLKMSGISSLFWRINTEPININNKNPIFMIKFITFSMENQKIYSNLQKLKKYVILGSIDLISLYCVEPLKEIFVIKKPDFISEIVVPDAQIGIGRPPDVFMRFQKKDEKNHLLLVIGWGKIIYFYQLPIVDGSNIHEYKELGYYINLFNILRIGFMNNSVIYCLDKSFAIKVLDSSKINSGKINLSDGQPITPKNNSLAEIEKSRLVSANISHQIKSICFNDDSKESYLYSIVENNDSIVSLVVLGEKQLYNVNLIDWEYFLNSLLKKEDFLNLFLVGIDLYKGKMMALSNIPDQKSKKKVIGDFLKHIVSEYVILNTGEKKTGGFFLEETEDKEKINQCMKMSIEFCIEIESVEYLLKEIQPLFEAKEYGELFLETLQPFILCDKIKDITLSSDIILNLIEVYINNGKLDTLSQMLLHLNIESIDKNEIKKKIEEYYLIPPLIYLYMNGQNEDYFAPLEKMFDFFYTRAIPSSKVLIKEDGNTIDYSNALTKKLITEKEVRNCKEYNGHRILWYIRWCLTGKKFPDSSKKMEKDLFDKLVPKIAYWLLNPKVIDEFLRFDPKNYFMIYKNIFSIEDLYKKLLNSANDTKYSIEVKTMLSTSDIKIDDIKPNSLIKYLVSWCKKKDEKKIYFYLYDFIICILDIEKEINKELKLEAICFILSNYTIIIKHINNQEVKTMNIKLIKIFEKETNFKDEDYRKILFSIEDKIFNEVKLYIYDKIDYFNECLKLYIDKDFNISGKTNKLFKWIGDKLLVHEKGTEKYDLLIDTIKEHSLSLATISLSKFYELSKEIFQGFNREIVDKLKDDKKTQLEFIQLLLKYIISTYENNENNVTNEEMEEIKYILGIHINLLCQLNMHDKIIPALKACSFYPLNVCLMHCEKAKAYQPCLFLYLKEGAIEKAFNMANMKLDDTFKEIINNINDKNDDIQHNNLSTEFNKYLTDIKDICENNELHLEELWFKILETLYNYEIEAKDLVNKNKDSKDKKKNSDDLYLNISKNIKELMEKMSSFVSIKSILEAVSEKSKNAGFKEFRDLLMEILSSYSNLSNILFSARNLLTNLVLENEHYFQILNLKGELLKAKKCAKCHELFNKNLNSKEKILVYNCNHVFHKNCVYKGDYLSKNENEFSCPICSELEFEQNYDKAKLSLIKKSNEIYSERINEKNNKFQVNLGASARRTLQKLERYDDKNLEKHKLMINNSIGVLKDQYRKEYK